MTDNMIANRMAITRKQKMEVNKSQTRETWA